MNELQRLVRDLADRQRMSEREALRMYRLGDTEQAHYFDGKVEAYGEAITELNRMIARESEG